MMKRKFAAMSSSSAEPAKDNESRCLRRTVQDVTLFDVPVDIFYMIYSASDDDRLETADAKLLALKRIARTCKRGAALAHAIRFHQCTAVRITLGTPRTRIAGKWVFDIVRYCACFAANALAHTYPQISKVTICQPHSNWLDDESWAAARQFVEHTLAQLFPSLAELRIGLRPPRLAHIFHRSMVVPSSYVTWVSKKQFCTHEDLRGIEVQAGGQLRAKNVKTACLLRYLIEARTQRLSHVLFDHALHQSLHYPIKCGDESLHVVADLVEIRISHERLRLSTLLSRFDALYVCILVAPRCAPSAVPHGTKSLGRTCANVLARDILSYAAREVASPHRSLRLLRIAVTYKCCFDFMLAVGASMRSDTVTLAQSAPSAAAPHWILEMKNPSKF